MLIRFVLREHQQVTEAIENGFLVIIAGSIAELGSWDILKAPRMTCRAAPCFEFELLLTGTPEFSFEYKYALVRSIENSEECKWEVGDNRRFCGHPSRVEPVIPIVLADEWRENGKFLISAYSVAVLYLV